MKDGIICRGIVPEDAARFWTMLNALDDETDCMMYEPGERRARSNAERLEAGLRRTLEAGDFLWVAEADGEIVGIVHAATAIRPPSWPASALPGGDTAWERRCSSAWTPGPGPPASPVWS